jgi:hypothetical protein
VARRRRAVEPAHRLQLKARPTLQALRERENAGEGMASFIERRDAGFKGR